MEAAPHLPTPLNLSALKTLGAIEGPEAEKTQVTISERDGSIQTVAREKFSTIPQAVHSNLDTIEHLTVAAKLLKGEKLQKNEKVYEKTALKVIHFYAAQQPAKSEKAERKEQEMALGQQFDRLAGSLRKQTALLEKARASDSSQKVIAEFASGKPLPKAEVVAAEFRNIDQDGIGNGHNSDGADVFRHLMAGIVQLTNNASNVLEQGDLIRGDLATPPTPMTPKEKVQELEKRLDVVFNTFAQKLPGDPETKTQLSRDKDVFLAKIRSANDPQSCQQIIDAEINSLRKGSPAQQNMGRLLHVMHQGFHMGPMSQASILLLNRMSPSYEAGGLNGTEFKQGDKKINIRFTDTEVVVEHRVTIRQTKAHNQEIKDDRNRTEIEQVTTLTAKLEDLSNWGYSLNCEVKASQAVEETFTAQKVFNIYQFAGLPSTLKKS